MWLATLLYVGTAVGLAVSALALARHARTIVRARRLRPAPAFHVAPALRRALTEVLSHRRLFEDPRAGWAHALLFYGFLGLFIGTCLVFVHDRMVPFLVGPTYLVFSFLLEWAGLAFLAGVGWMLWRRPRTAGPASRAERSGAGDPCSARHDRGDRLPGRSRAHRRDGPAVRGLVVRRVDIGGRLARDRPGRPSPAPGALGGPRRTLLAALRIGRGDRPSPHGPGARPARAPAAARPGRPGPARAGRRTARPGAPHLGPAARRRHVRPLRALHRRVPRDGRGEAARSQTRGPGDPSSDARGAPARDPRHPRRGLVMHDVRRVCQSVSVRDRGPGQARRSASHARRDRPRGRHRDPRPRGHHERGNPFGGLPADRVAWTSDLGVRVLRPGETTDILYWVGCAGAFDPHGRRITRATARLLQSAGVEFAILGAAETCTGDPARRMGEEEGFREAAARVAATLGTVRFRRLVTHCAHCFNVFRNELVPAVHGQISPGPPSITRSSSPSSCARAGSRRAPSPASP